MPGSPASIIPVSGAPQRAAPNAQFQQPLVVKVLDANGNLVSGVTVTLDPKGQGAGARFSGAITAVTDSNGIATSNALIASAIPKQFVVETWIGPIVAGAVGPASFWLSVTSPGPWTNPSQSIPAIQAAWTPAKAQLAAVQAASLALANALATFEASLIPLANLGVGDVVEWLQTNARRSRVGFTPLPGLGGVQALPTAINVMAIDPAKPRDLTAVDQRPIGSTQTGTLCQLS